MLLKIISLQRKNLAIPLGCALGTGVLFLIIVHCVMVFHSDPQSTPIIVQWLVGGAGAVALFVMSMTDTFILLPLSIRMGATRKQMVPTLLGMHLLLAVIIYLMGFAFTQLEWMLTQNVWIHMVDGLIIEDMVSGVAWWATAAMLGGGLLAGYFIGAVFARFGPKTGGYLLVVLWFSFIALQNGMLFGEISPLSYLSPVTWGMGLMALLLWIGHSFLTMSVGRE